MSWVFVKRDVSSLESIGRQELSFLSGREVDIGGGRIR